MSSGVVAKRLAVRTIARRLSEERRAVTIDSIPIAVHRKISSPSRIFFIHSDGVFSGSLEGPVVDSSVFTRKPTNESNCTLGV